MSNEKHKKLSKKEMREHQVLLGLVELYIETGKPIGSNTLRGHGFEALSSATIRNYFGELEKKGLLKQPHSSGGRIPTNEAFRIYADACLNQADVLPTTEEAFKELAGVDEEGLLRYLQQGAERLSEVTGYATFLSSVRFDHDFILEVKLVGIDAKRVLCVMITDFGQVLTEILPTEQKLSSFALKRIESHIQWKLKGGEEPTDLEGNEADVAQNFYNEMMVRYLVRYSNFSDEDVFRTGFSKLLAYPEFNDPVALATGLSLFENTPHMRLLLNDCARGGKLGYWIGNDLAPYASAAKGCAVIAIPYRIGQTTAGAIGILGPCRMPYQELFATLNHFSELVSQTLTQTLYKHKLSFRQPRSGTPYLQDKEHALVDQTKLIEKKDSDV